MSKRHKPLWHGILLVAGGAVGAGIFALPMVSAGAWMMWSTLGFIGVWLITYLAASLLSKVNLTLVADNQNALTPQSSFSALVTTVLDPRWATINNLSIVFIMMILMYAYTSAGASIVGHSLASLHFDIAPANPGWLSLLFATTIALVVWLGTSRVSQLILVLMIAMAITFGLATFSIVPNVKLVSLMQPNDSWGYLFSALPVYVTAFACAGLVPSLVQHYHLQPQKINQSLFLGTLLALAVYVFWLMVTLGSIGRNGFIDVISSGGNLAQLVQALVNVGADKTLQARLSWFSHFAIITSYLSVGLGLLHFMQDKLSLGDSAKARFIACCCCFVPPALASFFLPYGFVMAISYAGVFVGFSFFIVPGVMAIVMKKQGVVTEPIGIPQMVVLFGLVIVCLKVALLASALPIFE